MSTALQMTVFGLALLSTIFLLLATCTDCWMVNADDSLEVSRAAMVKVSRATMVKVSSWEQGGCLDAHGVAPCLPGLGKGTWWDKPIAFCMSWRIREVEKFWSRRRRQRARYG